MEVKVLKNEYANTYILIVGNEFIIIDPSAGLQSVRRAVGDFQFDKNSINMHFCHKNRKNNMHNIAHNTMHSTACCDEMNKLNGKICVGVFITHAHFDHIMHIEEYAKEGAIFYMSENSFLNMQDEEKNASFMIGGRSFKVDKNDCVFVNESDIIKIGGAEFEVLETVGHTDDSISLAGDRVLFCGDVIFAGGYVGRTDLPTGDDLDMQKTLSRISTQFKGYKVFSGHGESFIL